MGADGVRQCGRQHGGGRYREIANGPAESKTPGMQRNSMRENRETPITPVKSAGRSEKPMRYKAEMNGVGESSGCIVPTRYPNNAGGTRWRRVWREGGWPRRSPGMGLYRAQYRRMQVHYSAAGSGRLDRPPSSKVGTVCVRSASTGLCGGRSVMAVPTATRVPTRRDARRRVRHSRLRPMYGSRRVSTRQAESLRHVGSSNFHDFRSSETRLGARAVSES
jgi:hypothetical protein